MSLRGAAIGWSILLGLAVLCLGSGCQSVLFTAAYILKGGNVEPECKELKGKKVAVVCRPVVSLQFRNANVAKDLAKDISILLKQNVPKVQLVSHSKVADWMDENDSEELDYVQIGKAVKADYVVGVDVEQFEVLLGQTVYQGRAKVSIKLYNCKTGEVVFSKQPPQIVYPPNHVISTLSKPEPDFRRDFVAVVANQVGRYFYPHDPHEDIAMDSRAMD